MTEPCAASYLSLLRDMTNGALSEALQLIAMQQILDKLDGAEKESTVCELDSNLEIAERLIRATVEIPSASLGNCLLDRAMDHAIQRLPPLQNQLRISSKAELRVSETVARHVGLYAGEPMDALKPLQYILGGTKEKAPRLSEVGVTRYAEAAETLLANIHAAPELEADAVLVGVHFLTHPQMPAELALTRIAQALVKAPLLAKTSISCLAQGFVKTAATMAADSPIVATRAVDFCERALKKSHAGDLVETLIDPAREAIFKAIPPAQLTGSVLLAGAMNTPRPSTLPFGPRI